MSTSTTIQDRLRNTLRDAVNAMACLGASRSGVESANHRLSIKGAEDRFETILNEIPAWQPIQTAPKDGTCILGFEGGSPLPMRWRDRWWELDSVRWADESNLVDPTHWMPYPPDPTN